MLSCMVLPGINRLRLTDKLILQFYGSSGDAAGVQWGEAFPAVSIKLPKELFEDQDVTLTQILVANKEL